MKKNHSNTKIFVDFLLNWFIENKRELPWRNETDPYRILIAEKMLQQTTSGHVLKVYKKFIESYTNVNALSIADINEIEKLIRPLGFHKQRAKQLKEMANKIVEKHNGNVPQERSELLNLNGVGEYIANAVLCFAYKKDVPVIDINVRRVVQRVFNWGSNNESLYHKLIKMIPKGSYQDFNWAIIDYSALLCSRTPKCKKCNIKNICYYYLINKI